MRQGTSFKGSQKVLEIAFEKVLRKVLGRCLAAQWALERGRLLRGVLRRGAFEKVLGSQKRTCAAP